MGFKKTGEESWTVSIWGLSPSDFVCFIFLAISLVALWLFEPQLVLLMVSDAHRASCTLLWQHRWHGGGRSQGTCQGTEDRQPGAGRT